MAFITIYAGYLQIFGNYRPQKKYLLATIGIIIVCLMVIVCAGAIKRW